MIANVTSYSTNIIISFVLTPFLINTLGKETYSFYPIANTIVSYMSVLSNAMNSMASRFVTISLVQNKNESANNYFSSTLAANVILSMFLLIPMLLIVFFLEQIMDVPINSKAAIKGLFVLVFSSAIINVSSSVFGIATFAKNRIELRSLSEFVSAVLRLVLFFVLYKFLSPSIVYVGIVCLIVAVVNIVFQFFFTKKLLPEISLKKECVSLKHTKELLGASCWNAINTFGNILLAGMSMILANIFYGAKASGMYSIVNVVPQFICGVIVMLVGIFYPVITYKYAANDKQGLVEEIKNSQTIIGIVGCSVITVFSALAEEFFFLWTPGENSRYLSLISLVTIFPHLIICCMWSLTNLNVVMNKVKIPALVTLLCGVLNIIIAFAIYRTWSPGLMSLPIISSLLQVVWIGVFIPIYATKNLEIKRLTFYKVLFKSLICSIVVFYVILNLKMFCIFDSWKDLFFWGFWAELFGLSVFSLALMGPQKMKTYKDKIVSRFLHSFR